MAEYYVAEGGNDSASGSASAPWATPTKVNTVSAANGFKRGDVVRLEAGKVFPGQIITTGLNDPNGSGQLRIEKFGHGPAPELNGYKISRDLWEPYRPGVWMLDISANSPQITGYVAGTSTDVGHLRDGSAYRGQKRSSIDGESVSDGKGGFIWRPGLLEQWDFYSDTKYLYVRKDTSPGEGVRIAVRHSGFVPGSYTTATGLSFKGFGAHGGSIAGRTSVEFLNNIVDAIGGCYRATPAGTIERYGNGIEVFLNSRNFTALGNRVRQTFDVGATVQGDVQQQSGAARNILFGRNYFESCAQTFELWVRNTDPAGVSLAAVNFLENVGVDAGGSWSADVRADAYGKGIHLLTYDMQGQIDATVARNAFFGARDAFAWHRGGKPAGLKVYDNSIYLNQRQRIAFQDAPTIDNPAGSSYIDRSRLFALRPGDVLATIAAQTAFNSEVSRYWQASTVAG